MNKEHLLALHHQAAAKAGAFQQSLRDGSSDGEIGRCAREWDAAELALAAFREQAFQDRVVLAKQDKSSEPGSW